MSVPIVLPRPPAGLLLVAPCSFRGKPLGPPFKGTARVLSKADGVEADRVLNEHYGFQRRAYLKLFGQSDLGEHVEITPDPPADASSTG